MSSKKSLLLITAAVFVFISSYAQSMGSSIKGSVLSSGKKSPLAEAVITLTSQNAEGSRIALTDSTGNYNISNLTAGTYTITFEMEGYKTVGQSEVVLADGATVGLNIEMARSGGRSKQSNKEKVEFVVSKQP